mmetsp:Transcript_17274/g.54583  ORF Transcript_17274/g.54583 Transcript_17274/m.54583 type:complete len:576 (+) Transcript_17274:3-1730(+)
MAGGVIGVVAFAAIGGVLFGLDQGNWGGAIVKEGFLEAFCPGPPEECRGADNLPPAYAEFLSLGSSLLQLGAAVGALFVAPTCASTQGRRETMCLGSVITIAGAVPQALTTNVTSFLAARFVSGMGVGIVTYALPMFVSEISPAYLRGALGCSMQLTMVVGTVFASLLNCRPWFGYKWSFVMPAFPAAVVAVGIFCFPVSPRFALLQAARRGCMDDGVERAWKALRLLRGSDAAADEELVEIRADLEEEARQAAPPWSIFWTEPSLRRRVLVANMLQWLQQLTGVNAILSYGPAIFQSAGVPVSGLTCAVITNGFNLVATMAMMLVIDLWGRRMLLLLGAASMFVWLSMAAFLARALEEDWFDDSNHVLCGWALLGCVCLYMASFAIAWGGVPWVYPSEIFPMAVKERALSTSVFSQWMANFLIAYLVPQQVRTLKVSGTFAFYAACLAACFGLVYSLVPETKGLELEEMGSLFGQVLPELGEVLPELAPRFERATSGSSSACSFSFHDFAPLRKLRADTAPDMRILLESPDGLSMGELMRKRASSYDEDHGSKVQRRKANKQLHMGPTGAVAIF